MKASFQLLGGNWSDVRSYVERKIRVYLGSLRAPFSGVRNRTTCFEAGVILTCADGNKFSFSRPKSPPSPTANHTLIGRQVYISSNVVINLFRVT